MSVLTQKKVKSKSVKSQLIEALFIPKEQGINVNGITIPDNVTGEQIKAAKKQSLLVIERKKAAENRLNSIESLSQILKDVKTFGKDYLNVIEAQYDVKITVDMLNSVIPSLFIPMQTEAEKLQQAKHPSRWKFSKVLTLIARYYKTRLATEKLATRSEKALAKEQAAK
jgi:hypothetical protein